MRVRAKFYFHQQFITGGAGKGRVIRVIKTKHKQTSEQRESVGRPLALSEHYQTDREYLPLARRASKALLGKSSRERDLEKYFS